MKILATFKIPQASKILMNEVYTGEFLRLHPLFKWADEQKIVLHISSLQNNYTMTTDYYISADIEDKWQSYWTLKLS